VNVDYLQSFAISAAGMGVERARVEVTASNLANAHTVPAAGAAAYQPLRVVARSVQGFASLVEQDTRGAAIPTVAIEASASPPRLVHEPGHPSADAKGFVAYPGVDPATEMVTLMSATRAYEANVAAMNTARTLALKALEIGRNP
jgi:flagellar basal-body rod protein FlgC